jgi:transcriptional regulator GlxA family with amidase domain
MAALPHQTALIIFDGFQLLDMAGPASVYGAANDLLGQSAYGVTIVSCDGGAVTASCGIATQTRSVDHCGFMRFDSVFVTGGNEPGLTAVVADNKLRDWTMAACNSASRFGSICSGSLILAAWDLIGTRRFATHWSAAAEAGRRWPHLALDADAIYVEDGNLWTSAGVTTGIDMTLAIVEADHGPALARAIAQRLVLSARRPGWQSQFSPALAEPGGRYTNLIAWIGDNIDAPLSVETLAEHAGESLRSFHRNFTAATGSTPAHYVMRMRVDHARMLIGEGLALKQVARRTGFLTAAQLSLAFTKVIGMTANEWRLLHG